MDEGSNEQQRARWREATARYRERHKKPRVRIPRSEWSPERLEQARADAREKMRVWLAANKDRVNAEERKRRANDPEYAEQERAKGRANYARHRDKRIASARTKYHAIKNTEKFKEQARYQRLKRRYGLSALEYEMMKARQGGRCAICGVTPKLLFVDHDHVTGRVRELLCPACNGGVRKVEKLRAYMAYLEKHDAIEQRGHAAL